MLQLYGALPGLAALGLTLLINRAVLNAGLNFAEVATFALVIVSTQALPVGRPPAENMFFKYWQPFVQRIVGPAYLGLLAAYWGPPGSPWVLLPWIPWSLQAAGISLCVIGYFGLVHQLRAGIRPSGNENAFSPG